MGIENFTDRPRKGHSSLDALKWNVERLQIYSEALQKLPDGYAGWNEREKRENVKRIIRSDHELRWADKTQHNVYREEPINGDRIMEHTIPVSQWTDAVLTSGELLRPSVFFLAWIAPVVNLSKDSDTKLRRSGQYTKNHDPNYPFRRYRRNNIRIVNVADEDVSEKSLDNHYELIFQIPFMEDIREYALSDLRLCEAISWLRCHFLTCETD